MRLAPICYIDDGEALHICYNSAILATHLPGTLQMSDAETPRLEVCGRTLTMDEQQQNPDGPEQAQRWNESAADPEMVARKMMPNDRPAMPSQPAYTPPPPPYPPRPNYPPQEYAPQQSGYYPDYQPPRQPERQRRPGWLPWLGGCLVAFAVVTVVCAAASGIVWAMQAGSEPAVGTVTKTLAISGTPSIVLDTQAANVEVVRGDASQVVVTESKEVRAFSHDAAQRLLDQLTLDISQTGDAITITTNAPSFNGFPDYFIRRISLSLSVPQTSNLDTRVQAGNINISDVTGRLATDVQAGNLHLTDDTLASGSTVHVTAGNVDLTGALAAGSSMDVRVTAGNVHLSLPQSTSVHLQATAHAGNVSVNGWDVAVTRQNADASATGDLGPNASGALTIEVTAGNVTVSAA